jgi:4'-phosphopantetheinyl transferase EntD
MISKIVPLGVEAVETVGDDLAASLMFEEEVALGRVADGRRRDFTTGRTCARQALVKLGVPPKPIIPGPSREPLWPEGVVGSITHCARYAAAAVAKRQDFCSIGIDAEPHQELPAGVLRKVALPEEVKWLRTFSDTGIYWDRVLFSAKESVYKTWFPLTQSWLGFADAIVQFNVQQGTFHASLLIGGPIVNGERIQTVDGRFCISHGFVITFAALAANDTTRKSFATPWRSGKTRD